MRVAFFTGGTVGAGHLVRGMAVGNGLRRAGFDGAWRMFGPPLPFPPAVIPADYQAVPMDPAELRDPTRAPASALARALAGFAPDLLVVDKFWAPLYHFLPDLGCEAWMIVDRAPKSWLAGPPGTPFRPADYARVIAIEPVDLPHLTDRIDPVVVCNPDECRPPEALRARLGVAPDESLTVVLQAGLAGEAAALASDAAPAPGIRERVVTFDLHQDAGLFPAAPWLSGADRIVTGAGYNAFWEARWLGHVDRTEFHPLPRRIDDQDWRIDRCRAFPMSRNGADTLAALVGNS